MESADGGAPTPAVSRSAATAAPRTSASRSMSARERLLGHRDEQAAANSSYSRPSA